MHLWTFSSCYADTSQSLDGTLCPKLGAETSVIANIVYHVCKVPCMSGVYAN